MHGGCRTHVAPFLVGIAGACHKFVFFRSSYIENFKFREGFRGFSHENYQKGKNKQKQTQLQIFRGSYHVTCGFFTTRLNLQAKAGKFTKKRSERTAQRGYKHLAAGGASEPRRPQVSVLCMGIGGAAACIQLTL